MEKVVVENLSFQYPLGEKEAIKNISLTIRESDFVVLCGKSGCGKSTLLRHLKKTMMPYGTKEGTVYYDGEPLEEIEDRKEVSEIGYVQQNPDNQLVTDKVWHELAFGLENLGLSNSVIKRRVAEMASYFGIDGWFRKNVAELSGGQKQLLNLASVMAMQPKMIVLDEPTSQLDPIAASDFLQTVHKINRDLGTTVVICEHRLEEVFPLADHVIVLDHGEILTQGAPKDVGLTLYRGGADHEDEQTGAEPHPMYYGMPAAMRAFPAEKLAGESLPLTVREGRLLLKKRMEAKAGAAEGTGDSDREGNEGNKAAAGHPKRETAQQTEAALMQTAESAGKTAKDDSRKNEEGRKRVIRIKDAFFRYDKKEKDVLRGLRLEVYEKEIFTLLGGNGSGKSTTLKSIIGIVKPQRGKIETDAKLRYALVPQNPQALFTEITVEEEVLDGMAHLEMSDKKKVKRVEEMLKLMEIEHLRKANPYDLSGGEQQRLAIAKVMAYGPDVLLLDEPTKGLDPFFKRTLGGILRGLKEKGLTIFIVSHDIDFCAEYGDRSGLFFDGEIAAIDDSRHFFCGNRFYTTTTNKIVREWRSDLILCEEAKKWLEDVL